MTAQLALVGFLNDDFTVAPWRDPGVRRVDAPSPAAERDRILAQHAERRAVLIAAVDMIPMARTATALDAPAPVRT